MPQNQTPSQVVPILVAVLVCDVAVTDPSTGKKTLIGIFNRLWSENFPSQRAMSLYLKLTDAEGFYNIEVRFVHVNSGEVLAIAKGKLTAKDRVSSQDFSIEFPSLPIRKEGRHEFQIWANSIYLGGTFLDAVPLKPGSGKSS